MYATPYLQKYKGKTTRHTCPSCGTRESFTLYLDGNTHQPINIKVGKCNRESKCGYHYTPKQYFIENPSHRRDAIYSVSNNASYIPKPNTPFTPIGTIPYTYVERSINKKSNFVCFLFDILTESQIQSLIEKYALGATKNKEVIFWQIDIKQKVRTGKIMQYNPQTGKRIKHESGAIDWVHNKLKQSKQLPEDFNLQQCFFGEHLLALKPKATVCIVESEKSALISAAIFPDEIWLAAGNINGLSIDKCKALNGRKVILFPDLGAYEIWKKNVPLIKIKCRCLIDISNILEFISTPEAKSKGLDIADFMINQQICKQRNFTHEQTTFKRQFSDDLQSMIKINPELQTLIEKLQMTTFHNK